MATYPIRVFGDPVLKQRARDVEEFDGGLSQLARAMYDTMYEAVGRGLAAPQVGVQRRVFTYDTEDGPAVVVNPVVVDSAGECVMEEGCLSVPGMAFDIVRPQRITLQGYDLDGNELLIDDDAMLARVFQHEIDHLDGVLVLDRVDLTTRKQALKEIREHGLIGESIAAARVGGERSRL